MKALVLEDVARFAVRETPAPAVGARDVLIRIGAVGICGTDLHIFQGHANYNRDEHGHQIPLTQEPQILGHEFCGTVEVVGKNVTKFKPGDHVIGDQVLNCHSQGRAALCDYCETGDSHQCSFLEELGITGLPGAFAELLSLPEPNVLLLPPDVPLTKGAIVEPLACVLHASDRMERSRNRYDFEGRFRIRNILITGAGPSGLLFIQYLRNIKRFDGEILVADVRPNRLALAEKLGGTPLDARAGDLASEIRKRTRGELIHYWIEATGAGPVFDLTPLVLQHQATFLLYGAGHSGRDVGCFGPFQFMEANIVTTCGASGGFEPDGTPVVFRRSMEYLHKGLIDTSPLLSHRYSELSDLQQAFQVDYLKNDFIKGAWVKDSAI
jgi:threonine dehydrogenase-like Zn-dependent dehydrogenase